MATDLPAPERLDALADRVRERLGLDFPSSRRDGLVRALRRMAEADGTRDVPALVERLLGQQWPRACIDTLARELTVGETGFFRHPEHWEVLAEVILPERIAAASGRPIRVWSAACSSGEEPYSVAILLDRFGGAGSGPRFEITGTDINPDALAKARAAEYTAWSFRDAAPEILTRYFEPVGGARFRLAARIRARVAFAPMNLFDTDAEPPAGTRDADVILCRNVLIYFSPEKTAQLLRRLYESLAPGGWLLVSPAEVPCVEETLFRQERPGECHCFRRRDCPVPAIAPPVVDPPRSPQVFSVPQWEPPVLPEPEAEPYVAPVARVAPSAPAPAPNAVLADVQALFERGDYAGVLARVRAPGAKSAPQDSPALLRFRVRALANLGRTEEALHEVERLLAAHKTDAPTHYLHAVLLEALGRAEPALESVRRALFLDGELVMAHVLCGHLLTAAGRTDAASRSYAQALKLLECRDPACPVPESDAMSCATLRAALMLLLDARGGSPRPPMRSPHA